MNWYLKVLRQYADFKGRSRRKEYWMFTLFDMVIIFAIIMPLSNGLKMVALPIVYAVALFIPRMALSIRRLHDIGESAWWLVIPMLAVLATVFSRVWPPNFILTSLQLLAGAGSLWFIVLMTRNSQPGENRYGKNPKEEDQ